MDELLLNNDRVTLRPLDTVHVDSCFAAVRESVRELSPWLWWCHEGFQIEDARSGLAASLAAWKSGTEFNFGIFDPLDGSFLGGCGLNQINRTDQVANLGYWVRTSRTGRGLATAATLLVAGFGFEQLGLNRIEIVAATANHASQRVAEKTGARREGVLRRRLLVHGNSFDAILYALIETDLVGAAGNS